MTNMPKVTLVKKAMKDYPEAGIKKGEPYYWWKFRFGPKHYSKTPPKPQQLTQSDFLQRLYDIQDALAAVSGETGDELQAEVDNIKADLQELADECTEKHDNMPEGLQDGDTGQLLQDRAEALEGAIGELDAIDFEVDEGLSAEEQQARIQEIIDEIQGVGLDAE